MKQTEPAEICVGCRLALLGEPGTFNTAVLEREGRGEGSSLPADRSSFRDEVRGDGVKHVDGGVGKHEGFLSWLGLGRENLDHPTGCGAHRRGKGVRAAHESEAAILLRFGKDVPAVGLGGVKAEVVEVHGTNLLMGGGEIVVCAAHNHDRERVWQNDVTVVTIRSRLQRERGTPYGRLVAPDLPLLPKGSSSGT